MSRNNLREMDIEELGDLAFAAMMGAIALAVVVCLAVFVACVLAWPLGLGPLASITTCEVPR